MKNLIITTFDGKNFWPAKLLKTTKTRATIVMCNVDGKETGEPITRKIDDFTGSRSIQINRFEIAYLDRKYDEKLMMSFSDI